MFWFVCGKNWLLAALMQLKKGVCQFAEVSTNFYLILLKKRFRLLFAQLPCFEHYVSDNRLFLFFVPKLHFMSQKAACVTKLHLGHSILPKKCFGLLATKLGYLQPYDTEKSVSFFLCLKYAAFSFIAGKTCFGLFSVKLGGFQRYCTRKNVFCQFAASHIDFYLISLKTTFPFIFG